MLTTNEAFVAAWGRTPRHVFFETTSKQSPVFAVSQYG